MDKRCWEPEFACPHCSSVVSHAPGDLTCTRCNLHFTYRDGIYHFLSPDRLAELQCFLHQYRVIREKDGYRSAAPHYYRSLPNVAAGHPQAAAWRVRQDSYDNLRRRVLPRFGQPSLAILDLGAGNCWLSHVLSALGHRCVAVDWLDDSEDGLGASRHYVNRFVCVQADFDDLPLIPRQFDLVIFNGSLHYSAHVGTTLSRAVRMLASGGALLVMDSPMFRTEADGRAMVARKADIFRSDYGLTEVVQQGEGYLTLVRLCDAAKDLVLLCHIRSCRNRCCA